MAKAPVFFRRYISQFMLIFAFIVNTFCAWSYGSSNSLNGISLNPLFTFNFNHFDGSMDGRELIRGALEFSIGTSGSEIEEYYLLKYDSLHKKVAALNPYEMDLETRCKEILSLIYNEKLTFYQEEQTRMDVLFEDGTYNCVSSCILYVALCKDFGIDARCQRTKKHCFAKVYLDTGSYIVETTNPYGFNPGTKQPITDTRYAVVEKRNYENAREVCDRELAGLVAKNLCSYYIEMDVYDLAVGLAVTRMRFLDGLGLDDDSRNDFDAVCINYLAYCQSQEAHYDAFLWLCDVIKEYGMTDLLQKAYDNVLFNCLVSFARNGNYESADELFENNRQNLSMEMDEKLLRTLFLMRADDEVSKLSNKDALDYVKENIEYAQSIPGLYTADVKTTFEKWLDYFWFNLASEYFDRGEYIEAVEIASQGLQDVPSSANLKSIKKQALYNNDVKYHNLFAKYANAQDYEKAKEVLEEGLRQNPGSAMLMQDMNAILYLLK